jgi:hypothetical protein
MPSQVKLELRKEAGFGCCRCGLPIYQYHHIIPFEREEHFRPEDMMILCPNDHAAATEGALTELEQRNYKNQPFNIARGHAAGQLKSNQTFTAISLGSNQFVGDGCLIKIDGEEILKLALDSNSQLLLSVKLYGQNNSLLAHIDNNEWVSGDPLPWDIESSFQRLTIRSMKRDIALSVNLHSIPAQLRASLWKNGQKVELSPDKILVDGIMVRNVRFMGLCFVGLNFELDSRQKKFAIVPDSRFGQGCIVTEGMDLAERIEIARIRWLQLTGHYLGTIDGRMV